MCCGDVSVTLFSAHCAVSPGLCSVSYLCAMPSGNVHSPCLLLAVPMTLFAICPWRSHLSLDKDFLNRYDVTHSLSRISTEFVVDVH